MKLPTVEIAKTYLAEVSPSHPFLLFDGEELISLEELAGALENMYPSMFQHYVSHNKNDFANWVNHIIGDTYLGSLIKEETSQKKMASLVKERCEQLKEIIQPKEKPKPLFFFKKSEKPVIEKKEKSIKKVEKKKEIVKLPPPKPHQYLRNKNEHIHYGLKQFIVGFIFGVIIATLILIYI